MKKRASNVLALIMGFSMALSNTACDFGKEKETNTPKNGYTLTVSVQESPASLVAYNIEAYLDGDTETLVTEFLSNGAYRMDKGEPVVFEYQLEKLTEAENQMRGAVQVMPVVIEAEFSLYEDFSVIDQKQTLEIDALRQSQIPVYNLKTGEHYYFRMDFTLLDGQKISQTGEFETKISPRMINLDGANNVRDIGGWMTESGRRIKQGLLYRGSELDGGKNTGHADFCLTGKGIEQIRALGIKSDFDLRSESTKVSEYSIIGEEVTRTFYNAVHYQAVLLPENAETTRKIFSDLSNKDAYPVYLHCTHGVDRAGTASFLLEALLGVSKEDLIRDYELSAFYHNYKHVNRNLENGGNILKLMEGLEKFEGETFSDKVVSFMLSIGVTAEEINNIRSIFLA